MRRWFEAWLLLAGVVVLPVKLFALDAKANDGETVTITFYIRAGGATANDSDPCTCGGGAQDAFWKIWFYDQDWQNRGFWQGATTGGGTTYYCDVLNGIGPNTGAPARLSKSFPRGTTAHIRVELWDYDSCSGDDQYDVNNAADAGLTLDYDTVAHTWGSQTTVPVSKGSSADNGQVWFTIQSDDDNFNTGAYGQYVDLSGAAWTTGSEIAANDEWLEPSQSIFSAVHLQTNGGGANEQWSVSGGGPGSTTAAGTDYTNFPQEHMRSGTTTGALKVEMWTSPSPNWYTFGGAGYCQTYTNYVDTGANPMSFGGGPYATCTTDSSTYTVQFTGEILTGPETGSYYFNVSADDCAKFNILKNGSWNSYNASMNGDCSGSTGGEHDHLYSLTLNANTWYPVNWGCGQNGGGAACRLRWASAQGGLGFRYRTYQAYKLYGIYGSTVSATMSGMAGDLDLYLYDPFGNRVGSSTNGGTTAESISYTATENGYYTFVAANYYDGRTYFKFASLGGSDRNRIPEQTGSGYAVGTANPVPPGYGSGDGNVNYANSSDYYQVWASNGDRINASMQPPASANFDLYLFNPAGTQKASSTNGTNGAWDNLSFVTDSQGLWYFEVRQVGGYGKYNYEWSIGPKPWDSSALAFTTCNYTSGSACWMKGGRSLTMTSRLFDSDSTPGLFHLWLDNGSGWCGTNNASAHFYPDSSSYASDCAPASYPAVSAAANASTTGSSVLGCYRNKASTGNDERNFTGSCTMERADSNINFNWGAGSPGGSVTVDYFNVEWAGEVLTNATGGVDNNGSGTYRFCLNSDDGGFVTVNRARVVDDAGYHGNSDRCGNVYLAGNTWYPIDVRMFEAGGGAVAILDWQPPGGSLAVVPSGNLRYGGGTGPLAVTNWTVDSGTTDQDYTIMFGIRDEICTAESGQTCNAPDFNSGYTFNIDNTVPTVTNNTASAWKKADFTVNVSDSDSRSGVLGCRYIATSNNGNWIVRDGTVWVEDALPTGATWNGGGESPSWTAGGASGTSYHAGPNTAGTHQHYFDNATSTLTCPAGGYLIQYVYIPTATPPTEIMMQWNDSGGSWEHRAYWGANSIAWGTNNTSSRWYMGPIPSTRDAWIPLIIKCSRVGLDGAAGIKGWAYTLQDGTIRWDTSGVTSARTCNSSTSLTLTVGSASVCRDQGSNTCGLTVFGIDQVDNFNYSTTTYSIDWTAPTTTDNGVTTWSGSDQTVTLTPSDAHSGVLSTAYCVDTTNTCTPGTSGTSVSVTCAAGSVCQQYVRYRSTDNAGNVQAITTAAGGATIRIDKQGPPTVPGSVAVMLTGNKTLKATWTAASDGTGSGLAATPYGVQVGLTGADASGCAAVSSTSSLSSSPSQYRTAPAACTLTSMADNTQYCLIIRASDAVGNTSDSATVCATAVIANETVAGVVKGYPASATNQGANFIGTYTGSGNVVYLLDGSAGLVTSLTLGAGETISGAPFWSYEGVNDYAYVGTNDGSSIGRIYKIQNTDGAPANDPAGNTLATVSGWPITLPDKCGGAGTARQVTTPLVPDDKLVYFGMVDSGCAAGSRNYILAYEITPTSYDADAGGDGIPDKIVDVTACSSSGSMMSAPTVKPSPINWASARYLHIGSDCSTGELYRVRVDTGAVPIGTVDCQRDVAGEIQAWITGSFGKLFFGTLGGAAARFYVLQNTESGAACPTTAYADLSGFPYTPVGATDIPSGAKVNWTGLSDEAYFVDNSGRIYCVCQSTGTGCGSVGASCTGFPVLLESGVALREPLYHNGILYVVSNTARVYAVEALYDPSCSANNCDATASGTVKSTNGYTFRLDTSGVESTLAVRCTSTTSPCPSADTRLTLGTDTGRIFYLPVTP